MSYSVADTIESVARGIQQRLSAASVYGEPVTANGVTVIPVAKVAFGFGAGGGGGAGSKPASMDEGAMSATGEGGGGGGGGGGGVVPVGYIEIANGTSRWVPLERSTGELALRALTITAALAPIGGRRGFLGRMALALAGQAMIGRLLRPSLPDLPSRLRLPGRPEA